MLAVRWNLYLCFHDAYPAAGLRFRRETSPGKDAFTCSLPLLISNPPRPFTQPFPIFVHSTFSLFQLQDSSECVASLESDAFCHLRLIRSLLPLAIDWHFHSFNSFLVLFFHPLTSNTFSLDRIPPQAEIPDLHHNARRLHLPTRCSPTPCRSRRSRPVTDRRYSRSIGVADD